MRKVRQLRNASVGICGCWLCQKWASWSQIYLWCFVSAVVVVIAVVAAADVFLRGCFCPGSPSCSCVLVGAPSPSPPQHPGYD